MQSSQILWVSQDPWAGHNTQACSVQLCPPTTSIASKTLLRGQQGNSITWGMPQLLRCYSPVHFSPSRSSPGYNQGSIGKLPHPKGKNSTIVWRHNFPIRILPLKHFFPRSILWTGRGCSYGVPSKPHSN